MDIDSLRICNFMGCNEKDIEEMYTRENLATDILLRWSKLLEYDFFRIYTQHLILYSPLSGKAKTPSGLSNFRKNIYTWEMIKFILELIKNNEKSKSQIMEEYRIPKTTLYKWINKYEVNTKL